MKGYIHSYETCGAVDGPGIRFIVFTQGCPLRCKYCHNPDTWAPDKGQETTSEDLIEKIQRYKVFMKNTGGGLTVSGGEPLMQAEFVADLFEKARSQNLHTALDTSGAASAERTESVLKHTDLMLLDVKSTDPDMYKNLTGGTIDFLYQSLELAQKHGVEVWLRLVVVPGFTDKLAEIEKINLLQKKYSVISKVELLPFHKMGEYKWAELGLNYELEETNEPDSSTMAKLQDALNK